MADHDVAEENNADRDQSVEAEEERRVIFIIIIMETVHEVVCPSYGHFLNGNSIVFRFLPWKLNSGCLSPIIDINLTNWCHQQ